ncbi:MAG: primosomal protein N' [Candidatus Nomurabacteria bacterium]|jgi:primosomal protein N' (replication factor Y)|nr:primosomal protein N' [Candidatus Nomurabacteria bacterium]
MYYYEVIPNVNIGATRGVLTYESSAKFRVGQVVETPVGKRQAIAIVVNTTTKPKFPTKPITRALEDTILPEHIVSAVIWLSEYYRTPKPTVLQAVLPVGITKKRRCKNSNVTTSNHLKRALPLNKQQFKAIDDVKNTTSNTVLLHGVTGSGKTNVYIHLAQEELSNDRSSIILVPEISLTTQLVNNFSQYFPNVVVIHSNQTEAERHTNWERILRSDKPLVVVGPRSAIFAPVKKLGLVVIDEAHEPSYKQEQSPKYNSLRLASYLAKRHGFKAVFGTATPLVTDYYLAKRALGALATMKKPAVSGSVAPQISVVNLTTKHNFTKHRFFSNQLITSIEQSLNNGKQVLLFQNKRGSANLTICGNCGWQALCSNCYIPLTLHTDAYKLICHLCGKKYNITTSCPNCNNTDIVHKGVGTKLIESEATRLWPKVTIARFDGDTPKEFTLNNQFEYVKSGKTQILIGTQVLAKGLDLPNLETVGVVQADANLSLPDFNSEERVFQLLSQVIGRVGRNDQPSNVIIQTYQPESETIRFGTNQDYARFYDYLIKKRRKDGLPPFSYLLKLTCSYKTESTAVRNARQVAELIREKYPTVQVLGPAPSFYERRGEYYRWQVVVKSKKRATLLQVLSEKLGRNWQFDIDPNSLL